jgi:hypothetical protein
MQTETRKLKDLVSIGPAMLEDLGLLGIQTVVMYRELCRLKRQQLDPCCLDVFVAAVAQAKNPRLPIEQRQWWYWSKVRKARTIEHLRFPSHDALYESLLRSLTF